jgi:trimeric autotransporter adhesin
MPLVTVNLVDTFDEWRIKTNTIGSNTGDITTLSTVDKTSIVAAINEVVTNDSDDLENIVEDTTPQLGGNLFLNSFDIEGTGNISIVGDVVAEHFFGEIYLANDPAPKLSANLNLSTFDGSTLLSTFDIVGTGNINITGSLTATSIAGTVTGTTQSASDNSTKLATTAYVDAQVETENTLEEMNDTVITTPTNGQSLIYNGTNWINSTPTSAGATEGFAVAVAIALG